MEKIFARIRLLFWDTACFFIDKEQLLIDQGKRNAEKTRGHGPWHGFQAYFFCNFEETMEKNYTF